MKAISFEELERRLVARKRELGIVGVDFLPLNDGMRRTASKRRLLRAIAENAHPKVVDRGSGQVAAEVTWLRRELLSNAVCNLDCFQPALQPNLPEQVYGGLRGQG